MTANLFCTTLAMLAWVVLSFIYGKRDAFFVVLGAVMLVCAGMVMLRIGLRLVSI